jgi:hypothetical protein
MVCDLQGVKPILDVGFPVLLAKIELEEQVLIEMV